MLRPTGEPAGHIQAIATPTIAKGHAATPTVTGIHDDDDDDDAGEEDIQ